MARSVLGFPHRLPAWMGGGAAGRRMGELVGGPERDRIMVMLGPAEDAFLEVRTWVTAQRDFAAAIGPDRERFTDLWDRIGVVAPAADSVYAALRSDDPADWSVTSEQAAAVDEYVSLANQLWSIVQWVKANPPSAAGPGPAPATGAAPSGGAQPAPGAIPGWVMPAAGITAAALPLIKPPSTPAPPGAPPAPPPGQPAPPKGGVPTPLIVAGAVAAGGGLLWLILSLLRR